MGSLIKWPTLGFSGEWTMTTWWSPPDDGSHCEMNFVRLSLFFPLFQIINGNATKSLWD